MSRTAIASDGSVHGEALVQAGAPAALVAAVNCAVIYDNRESHYGMQSRNQKKRKTKT
jgi:ABC-type molybdate transport system substrate-binding protein